MLSPMAFLDRIAMYRRIVDAGSITRAAQSLGVSPPAVSRALSRLEQELGAELIARNTRRMRVTEAGHRFYEHCLRIEREVARAKDAVKSESVVGRLSVSTPVSLGLARISPLMPSLISAHPGLHIDLGLEDRRVDLVAEGVDVAIRAGASPRSSASLISRRLYRAERLVVAAPAYVHRRGAPRSPADLSRHEALLLTSGSSRWQFRRGRTSYAVDVKGSFTCTALLPLRDAAIRAAGVALLPDWMVRDALSTAELVRLLGDYQAPTIDVFALYRVELRGDRRVRALLQHLGDAFAAAG